MQSTAVAVVERPRPALLRPIAAPKDVLVAQEETRKLIQETLTPKRDYGRIQGTDKDTLFKAGAERVVLSFGCYARPVVIEKEIDHDRVNTYQKKGKELTSQGLYRYVVECQIVSRETGEIVGSFIGSCSSMESKYISRPRDSENTIVKMAEKRALVGATLTTFGLSDQFTQDLEEVDSTHEEKEQPPLTRESLVDWGKFAETPTAVKDLPDGYIKWAAEDGRKFGPRTEEWQKLFRAELDAREIGRDQERVNRDQRAGEKGIVTDDELEEDRSGVGSAISDEELSELPF